MGKTLTIKDICKYLPHGLKLQGQSHGEIATLTGIVNENVYVEEAPVKKYPWADFNDIKLVLYPFDLISPLPNGKIPLLELAKLSFIFSDEDTELEYGYTNETFEVFDKHNTVFSYSHSKGFSAVWFGNKTDVLNNELLYEYMYENFLDVNDLIFENLAVDVNTLYTNPYLDQQQVDNVDIQNRITIVNKIIDKIATTGRKFFNYKGEIAYIFQQDSLLYMHNEYNHSNMLLDVGRPPQEWHHGGMLWCLISEFVEFIKTGESGEKYSYLYYQHWGYKPDEMLEIQEYAKSLEYLKNVN